LAAVALLWAALPARAHNFTLTEVIARIDSNAGGQRSFTIDVTTDLDALALGVDPGLDSVELAGRLAAAPPAEQRERGETLRAYFERRVRVRFDGEPAPFAVEFPEAVGVGSGMAGAQLPTTGFFGVTARLTGSVPPGARNFTFFASRAFPPVRLVFEAPQGAQVYLVEHGGESPALALSGAAPERGRLSSLATTLASYGRLGFEHIVPKGVDHILFVLGLFLLTSPLDGRWRSLLWQVSAFTVAHTLTLALAIFGVVSLPARPVEVAIALSIAWVAIENVFTDRLHFWRPVLVFLFGLLHGLGFAGVLTKLGLPSGEAAPALIGFNVGVEVGQLSVLAVAFLVIAPFGRRPWYRRLTVALSLAIAAVGLYWAVQRMLG
jgi:hypothetical protein